MSEERKYSHTRPFEENAPQNRKTPEELLGILGPKENEILQAFLQQTSVGFLKTHHELTDVGAEWSPETTLRFNSLDHSSLPVTDTHAIPLTDGSVIHPALFLVGVAAGALENNSKDAFPIRVINSKQKIGVLWLPREHMAEYVSTAFSLLAKPDQEKMRRAIDASWYHITFKNPDLERILDRFDPMYQSAVERAGFTAFYSRRVSKVRNILTKAS